MVKTQCECIFCIECKVLRAQEGCTGPWGRSLSLKYFMKKLLSSFSSLFYISCHTLFPDMSVSCIRFWDKGETKAVKLFNLLCNQRCKAVIFLIYFSYISSFCMFIFLLSLLPLDLIPTPLILAVSMSCMTCTSQTTFLPHICIQHSYCKIVCENCKFGEGREQTADVSGGLQYCTSLKTVKVSHVFVH